MVPQDEISQTIRRVPWFADLTPRQIERLVRIASLHHLMPGETIFLEGDREDALFILLDGQVDLEIEVPTRGHVTFYRAEVLDIIGWSSLTPIVRQRTASVRVVKECMLIGFNSKLLQQMCDEDHELGYIIMRKVANVAANRLLTMRLALLDIIAHAVPQPLH